MSWTGIKKAINRAGVQVMLKTGSIEETVDKEYDFEEKRFKTMETQSIKLHKELKHYLESLRILGNAQVNISEVLKSFYGNHDDITKKKSNNDDEIEPQKYENFPELYYHSLKEFNEQSLAELEQPYNQTVLNPIARFNSYYIEINEAIKKRSHKKLDYDAMKSKVRKLIDKPDSTHDDYETKLKDSQAQLISSELIYSDLNEKLKTELPRLINLRIPYLDPSFESFVKLQLRFFNENYNKLNDLQATLDAQTRLDYINGNLDKKLDNVLDKMRELNITGV